MLRAHKVPCTQLNSEAKISLSAHGTPPMFKYHCTVRAGMLASCATLLSAPAYSQLPSISLPSVSIPTLDDLRRNIIPTPPVLPQEIERIIPPQFREAVRQPTAVLQGTIDEATRKAVGHLQKMADDAKNDGNAMAETTIRQASQSFRTQPHRLDRTSSTSSTQLIRHFPTRPGILRNLPTIPLTLRKQSAVSPRGRLPGWEHFFPRPNNALPKERSSMLSGISRLNP